MHPSKLPILIEQVLYHAEFWYLIAASYTRRVASIPSCVKLSISVTISFAYFCPIAVVAPSATPSVLSGINRIQRWSQSKPLYLVFLLSSCQYIVFLWKGRGDIRNKHPFGHEAGCSPLPGSVNSGTRK